MPEQPVNDQMIIDYLLGALPELETERLDEMSVTDDDFAERLHAVENDLVDSYVRGELSENALRRFKSHYLASAGRREKVSFTKAFVEMVDKSTVAQNETQGIQIGSRQLPPALQWGLAAAALVILLAGGYLMFENMRLRNQMVQMQAEHDALGSRKLELERQLARERSTDSVKEKELARVRDRLAQLEQQLAASRPELEQRKVKVLALNLSPQNRGVSKIPVLAVPAGIDAVAVTLELEANDFPAYQAALKNPATSAFVWRSDTLNAGRENKLIQFRLPASLLKAQNYVLELSGILPGGTAEIVGTYSFRVITR